MNKMAPLVSVIVTTFNRRELARRAVKSVLSQTYENFECIVVDDRSTDGTLDNLMDLAQNDERVRLISHIENRHLSKSRNTGIFVSSGEFVAFLDDDDEWLSSKIEKQIELIKNSSSELGLVYCWMNYYDGNSKKIKERHPNHRGFIFSKVLESQPLGNGSTFLVKKNVFEDVGYFDEDLKRGIDGDFIRRLCYKYKVDFVPAVLVKYYTDHGNVRITREDRSGILNAIESESLKLDKFKNELMSFPKQKANIIASIGLLNLKLNNWSEGKNYFIKAIRIYPFSSKIYYFILKSLKHIISEMIIINYKKSSSR